MGIQISEIIPRKEILLKDLRNKTIAVDGMNALYQFLTTIRQVDGTPLMDKNEKITSHLSGLFYRNLNLILEGIKLIYVFDGKPPELKAKEIGQRIRSKEIAKEKYEKSKEEGNNKDMKKYSQQFVKITDALIKESGELLDAMGIPVVQAIGEGEGEAACLAKLDMAWGSASQDYDSLLYGTPRLIRNLTLAKKRKTVSGFAPVSIELVELENVINALQINIDQLICLGILVGTDYNPGGIKGIGQKRALEIVKQQKYPVKIFEYIEKSDKYELDFDWQKIYQEFKHPKCLNSYNLTFKKPDSERIKKILMSRDFSEERIDSALNKLKEAKEKGQQTTLF
ncbi:MAG: flap endonuclease-1 [Nanoarchaeota archaeon]